MTRAFQPVDDLQWQPGPLGDAVDASCQERLRTFVVDRDSEPIALFSPEVKSESNAGDWYGEHAGKWLCAASLASRRTKDETLAEAVRTVVRSLAKWQEPDGSLSAYSTASPSRMTSREAGKVRTWDVWIHAWMIRGLASAAKKNLEADSAKLALQKAADLLLSVINSRREDFLSLGNHSGLSAAVAIDALSEASELLERQDYLQGATSVLEMLEASGIHFLSGPKKNLDASQLGTGKIYQIIWILLGMAKLARLKNDPNLLSAVRYWWQNIRDHHLTPFGGPWGGVGGHFEVFNQKGFFSPEGMVETCSTATWISLSRELFSITGEAAYVSACETSLLNGILGALDQNGADWSYFSFPNGRRNSTYHWACCKSSGALALEEASDLPVWRTEGGFLVAMLQPCRVICHGTVLTINQLSASSWEVCIESKDAPLPTLEILIPTWADGIVETERRGMTSVECQDRKLILQMENESESSISFDLVVKPRVHPFTDIRDHHGQEIVRTDYACLTWGPYVYATGLIEGYRKEETLRLARLFPLNSLIESPGKDFPTFELKGQGRTMVKLEPYFLAGGRHDGAWRALWQQVAWQ